MTDRADTVRAYAEAQRVTIYPTPVGDLVTLSTMTPEGWRGLAAWIIAEKLGRNG